MANTASALINVFESWLGYSEYNGKHMIIINIYNNHPPLARGYRVQSTDAWCDTAVSAAAIQSSNVDIIGTECGCENHIQIFRQKGIWIEDGTIVPKRGDIILYNWDTSVQPNNGVADHIGVVVSVSGNQIKVIEGNKGNAVAYRWINVGNGNIRGYARPKYKTSGSSSTPSKPTTPSTGKTVEEVAKEVIAGSWGVGDDRKARLEAAGYNYLQVQAKVNDLLNGSSKPVTKTVEQIAKEVLAGAWGNGDIRKKNLEAAGYNYNEVQKKVNELMGGSSSDDTTVIVDNKTQLIVAGQIHCNNFCNAGLVTDGVFGVNTRTGLIKALQTALILDYGASITADGVLGTNTKNALGNHYVKKGETQFLATFVELALYCKGYNPNGCESPGTVGSGCDAAIRQYQADNGLTADGVAGRSTILSLVS